jgi:hypothetical protein
MLPSGLVTRAASDKGRTDYHSIIRETQTAAPI